MMSRTQGDHSNWVVMLPLRPRGIEMMIAKIGTVTVLDRAAKADLGAKLASYGLRRRTIQGHGVTPIGRPRPSIRPLPPQPDRPIGGKMKRSRSCDLEPSSPPTFPMRAGLAVGHKVDSRSYIARLTSKWPGSSRNRSRVESLE